jgi:hypothetical protein
MLYEELGSPARLQHPPLCLRAAAEAVLLMLRHHFLLRCAARYKAALQTLKIKI